MGRLESELLQAVILRVFSIMWRAGALPEPPAVVLDNLFTPAGQIDIQYEGPLARSQRASDVAAIEGTITDALPLLPTHPTLLDDNFDLDGALRYIGLARGVPAKLVRDAKYVANAKAERAEAQAKAAQQQQMMDAADAAGKGAPLLKAVTDMAQGGGS
ncbi:MAG: portal protein, partial [Vicinamibacteria bacterium]